MSGFLSNLLRRGAGLPPLVAPRRMDLPAELPVPDVEEDWGAQAQDVLSPTAPPATPEPEQRRPPETAASPVPAPQALVKAAEASVEATRTTAPVPSVDPPVAVQAAPRERPPEPAVPRQDRPREAKNTVDVLASPRVNPPPLPVLIETRVERIAAPPEEQPSPAPALPAATPKAAPPAAAEPPLPLAPIAPPPETPAALQALDEAQPPEEPRIEVRIGRIEIRQAPLLPPPVPAPRREPRGFPEHSLARRYLDRRWY